MNIVNLHIGKLNLCYVAYIYNGGGRWGEGGGERQRVPCRIMLCTMRWELHYVFKHNHVYYVYYMANCIHPTVAYVYNGEFVSIIGNQLDGISPPKSTILFHLSLALK